jgi:TonB family protein
LKPLILIYLLIFSFPILANFTNAEKYYNQGEYSKSFDEYHKLAKLGNIRAQYRLAVMHFDGIGVEKNAIKAFAWSKTAGSSKSSTKTLSDKIAKTLNGYELEKAHSLKDHYILNYGIIATNSTLGPILAESNLKNNSIFTEYGSHNDSNFNNVSINKENNAKLEYPKKAIKKSSRGWVDLYFNIYPNGKIHDISILQQYPHELFASAAIEYVQKITFEFYMDNKRVTPNENIITIQRFKFGEEGRSGLVGRKTKRKISEIYHSAVKGNIEDQYHYTNLFYTILNKTGMASEKMINSWLFKASRYGFDLAQYRLGRNIYFGNSCVEDQQKGFEWIIKSAQRNNNKAQYLAYQIIHNNPKIKNVSGKPAHEWLTLSAENNSDISQFILAKHSVAKLNLSDKDINLATKYLDNYAINVGKTIDWYETKIKLLITIKQFKEAKKSIKVAMKMAKKANWNLSELKHLKNVIENK